MSFELVAMPCFICGAETEGDREIDGRWICGPCYEEGKPWPAGMEDDFGTKADKAYAEEKDK